MGQFSDGNYDFDKSKFEFFDKYKSKHWADIEGDWLGKEIPKDLDGINITINGLVKGVEKRFNKIFVRPTFSYYLMNTLNRADEDISGQKSFGFMGYPDPHGLRRRLQGIVAEFPGEYYLTNRWNGPAKVGSPEHISYETLMKRHIFSLCPRGCGHDSVRFYEACFLGRVPIIIGDNYLFGELDGLDVDFAIRVSQYSSDEYIQQVLESTLDMSDNEIKDRQERALKYFQEVRKYLKNSTKYFLEQNGLFIH